MNFKRMNDVDNMMTDVLMGKYFIFFVQRKFALWLRFYCAQ